jgi:Tol biopolymer transport system component
VPFDADRLETRGNAVAVLEGVAGEKTTGASAFALSENGTLFFVPGTGGIEPDRVLAWLDASGTPAALPTPARPYLEPTLSPDGRRVAVTIHSPASDIWIYDLDRGALSRLTFGPNCVSPVWSADGTRVFYTRFLEARVTRSQEFVAQIAARAADGTGEEEVLWSEARTSLHPRSASADGQWLLFHRSDPATQRDIWILPLTGDRKPRPWLATPHDEAVASMSPDGRFVAYSSNETGTYETHVRPFPDAAAGRWQVSTEGGGEVYWSADGRTLVMRQGPRFWTAAVSTDGTFRHDPPRGLFETPRTGLNASSGASFALSRDGRRILFPHVAGGARPPELVVILGWAREALAARPSQ